jgi:hypothetical protein
MAGADVGRGLGGRPETSGYELMHAGHLQGLLASSGTSTGTLIVIVIGEALIIGLLALLVVLLRRNLDKERTHRRDRDAAFVSGTLEVPLDRPTAAPGSGQDPQPPAPPDEGVAVDGAAAHAPPPAVSWDMNKQEEEDLLDPENMPIPAYTGPKLAQTRSSTDVDFDLGIPNDFGDQPAAEAAAAAAASDNGDAPAPTGRRRRSRRAGQAPPPPFT